MFLDIFESAENRQHFVSDDGLIWLHGTLLAEKLGFKNVSQAVQLHTEEDERQQINLNGRLVWFISEYGVWGMILASKTSEALDFKRKLKREILPKLRASGGYIMPTTTSEQVEALVAQHEADKAAIAALEGDVSRLRLRESQKSLGWVSIAQFVKSIGLTFRFYGIDSVDKPRTQAQIVEFFAEQFQGFRFRLATTDDPALARSVFARFMVHGLFSEGELTHIFNPENTLEKYPAIILGNFLKSWMRDQVLQYSELLRIKGLTWDCRSESTLSRYLHHSAV
jgi:prophage antirepressor-like protein